MAEIIFPDEILEPAECNWDNPDTDSILTLQYDDGTTVTNALTGATGETFDTANELGSTGVQRVSATWSTTKPTGIDDNPFSLFKTEETKREEYALVFDGVNDKVSFGQLSADNIGGNNIRAELEVSAAMVDNETLILVADDGDTGAFYVLTNGKVTYRDAEADTVVWADAIDTSLLSDFNTYRVNIDYDGTNRVFDLYVNDVFISTQTGGSVGVSTVGLNSIGYHGGTYRKSKHKYLSFIDRNNPTNSRLWIFDRKDNPPTIGDEYNGAIATLIGSPVFERVIEKQSFDTTDYTTIVFLNIQNNQGYQVNYDVLSDIEGGSLSGFANGLTITSSNESEITSPVTLTTTGYTRIHDMTLDDVDATGATEVHIDNCEVVDVTG